MVASSSRPAFAGGLSPTRSAERSSTSVRAAARPTTEGEHGVDPGGEAAPSGAVAGGVGAALAEPAHPRRHCQTVELVDGRDRQLLETEKIPMPRWGCR